jgi:hypothetical protein
MGLFDKPVDECVGDSEAAVRREGIEDPGCDLFEVGGEELCGFRRVDRLGPGLDRELAEERVEPGGKQLVLDPDRQVPSTDQTVYEVRRALAWNLGDEALPLIAVLSAPSPDWLDRLRCPERAAACSAQPPVRGGSMTELAGGATTSPCQARQRMWLSPSLALPIQPKWEVRDAPWPGG